jgi:CBS domain-containing protein
MPVATVGELMRTPLLTVRPEDDLRLARQMMLWAGCHHLPVTRGGHLVGMVSDRAVADRHLAAPLEPGNVEEVMQRFPQTAHPGDRVGDAALRMSELVIDALPVTDEGLLVGIVTTTDILANEARRHVFEPVRRSRGTVGDHMTRDPVTVLVDDHLADALDLMIEHRIRHLPVVDREGALVGMLSDRDLRMQLGAAVLLPREQRSRRMIGDDIASAMTPAPVTVEQTEPLAAAIALLVDARIGALPVVDEDDRLVGVLSYIDVLRQVLGS